MTTTLTKTDHGQITRETQSTPAVVDHIPTAIPASDPRVLPRSGHTPGSPSHTPSPDVDAGCPDLSAYKILRVWAEMLEDAQKARIAANNRALRADVDPTMYAAQIATMETAEHQVALAMRRCYRTTVSPEIRGWQTDTIGIGEHLLARLLGVVGHPVWTERYRWEGTGTDRTLISLGVMRRRVSDLWSYCGHGDATRKRRQGMTADEAAGLGNPRAKMITRLLAEACMKNTRSPYRPVYDEGRARYSDRDGWSPAHQHSAALRLVGKEILRSLWLAGGGGDQMTPESQDPRVPSGGDQ